MGDNGGVDTSPFKGPFKGKGANRKALRQLTEDMSEILSEMESVVDHYNTTFRSTGIINLRILRRDYPLLWWREAKQSGNYVRLFQSEQGLDLFNRLMPQAQSHLLEFDRQRLYLNFRAALVGNTLRAYARYEEGMSQLDKLTGHVR